VRVYRSLCELPDTLGSDLIELYSPRQILMIVCNIKFRENSLSSRLVVPYRGTERRNADMTKLKFVSQLCKPRLEIVLV